MEIQIGIANGKLCFLAKCGDAGYAGMILQEMVRTTSIAERYINQDEAGIVYAREPLGSWNYTKHCSLVRKEK